MPTAQASKIPGVAILRLNFARLADNLRNRSGSQPVPGGPQY
jgi:hypothetical protein